MTCSPRRAFPSFALALVAALLVVPAAAHGARTVPGEVVVAYKDDAFIDPDTGRPRAPRILRVRDVEATIRRLRARPDVRYAVPNVVARASAEPFIPNDPGRGTTPGGWTELQWNFIGPNSVNAPQAWGNLIAAGRPGGRGVKVAVLDTGVAYRRFGRIPRSPDLAQTRFVAGYDFVQHDPYANDPNGHGTHVASTIAESTNNGRALTGLAYGVSIMPVRVLDRRGDGDATVIARGVRFAVDRGAKVINLSLEFSADVTARDVPQLMDAINYAYRKGVVVVAAAGNEAVRTVAYPARSSRVISVGSITEHGCLSDFSNQGRGLDVVAPGGGEDSYLNDPNCKPDDTPGRNIFQLTLTGPDRTRFGIPSTFQGTSMAVPHVSATAALIIASGVLGKNPSPAAVTRRLTRTARDMGPPGYDTRYGWGLIDAGRATDPTVPVD
jgi:serine protease